MIKLLWILLEAQQLKVRETCAQVQMYTKDYTVHKLLSKGWRSSQSSLISIDGGSARQSPLYCHLPYLRLEQGVSAVVQQQQQSRQVTGAGRHVDRCLTVFRRQVGSCAWLQQHQRTLLAVLDPRGYVQRGLFVLTSYTMWFKHNI